MKNTIKKWTTFLLLSLAVSSKGSSQNQSLRFEHIGVEDGISNEIVTSVLQDRKGYIWLGTIDGLNKYDGYSFTSYKLEPFDTNSISQNWIYTIFEDKHGAIWVSSFEGLCKFERSTEKFTRYKPLPGAKFSDPNISAINEDKYGMLWVGTHTGGLARFDRQKGMFLPESFDLGFRQMPGDPRHDGVTCIYKDRSGTLWVGNTTGLHQLNVDEAKPGQLSNVRITSFQHDPLHPDSLNGNFVMAVMEDKTGMFWIATNNGLNSFDRRTGKFKRYVHDPKNSQSISSNNLSDWAGGAIREDKEGNLWIGTNKGLNKLNKERTVFTTYSHNPDDPYSLSSDIINFLEIDQAGVLWAGSWSGRLNKANLNDKGFGLVRKENDKENSLSNNQVTSIIEDSSGIVWIGTFGGGLNRWDRKGNQFTHYQHDPANPTSLKHDDILAIFQDRTGQLWICNRDVLSRLNKKTGQFIHYKSNIPSYKIYDQEIFFSITEDQHGFLWIGTGNGVKKFNKNTGEYIKHYYYQPGDSSGISDYTATAIFADSRDNIWIGHGSIATDRLDQRTGNFTHYKNDPNDSSSISSNIVTCFYEDNKGGLWLGTLGGGLCRFDYQKEKFTTFTDKQGLINNTVFSIVADNDQHLWLGTLNGLSRFDPVTKTFTNYDYKDGLQSNVFSAGQRGRAARFRGKDGVLYFGGENGFNFFDPRQLKTNTSVAPTVITQFKLFDKPVKGASELEKIILKYDQNYFSFEFSSLSYYNPEKNKYAYKLEGVDRDWVYSGSRRYVAYTNIDPGKYTFKVKGTNNDGVWNEKGVSMTIIIKPPWWQTWWAYCIYGLLLIVAALAIHRYQKQRVIRVERERAQKKELAQAKEIEKAYHELRTTQSQLIQSEKMASLGELTAGIAHEIQNPLNFVNNFSEVNRELITDMKEELTKGNIEEVKSIAANIDENEQKINHHGKRADAIVKSMLQHTRSSSGIKEPTNINALADEYLRLSYHGLRARDKSFNATMKTDFDESIDNINVIRQDIGRVILNLINNAFYAVTERKKQAGDGYEPTVSVSTKKINGKVEVRVKDNGNGIPQKVLDKIFQPFFTTKPAGQGTGLGLSLAYDIVKAHGGELKVETKEDEGAEFVIHLPRKENL